LVAWLGLQSLMAFGGVAARDPARFANPLSLAGARLLLRGHVALFAVAAICGPLIAMALSRLRKGMDVSAGRVLLEHAGVDSNV
jgi:hypothetical protein